VSETPPEHPAPVAAPPPGLPWEDQRAGLGAIFPTLGRFIARPSVAYAQMSLTVDLVRPLAYFVGLALIGACISQLWSFLFYDSLLGVVRSLAGPQFEKLAPFFKQPGALQLTLGLVITPLVALIVLFIWAGIVHLMLVLLGGASRGFSTTLRVMCYAESTQIAVVVPGLGGFVAFFWRLILEMIGLSQAHKTEGWKAAVAVLFPLVLCCACVAIGIVAFGAAVGQALQQLK
jgi:hypothetical protein